MAHTRIAKTEDVRIALGAATSLSNQLRGGSGVCVK